MIKLKEITRTNYITCCNLKVSKEQENFVAPNVWSLAKSKYEPECIPLAIYKNDDMVGFIMYCIDVDDGHYWIYRMMIDERYQRKGYAYEAMRQLINIITADKAHDRIYIDCVQKNIEAQNLYAKLGFVRTDDYIEKDCVFMRFDY